MTPAVVEAIRLLSAEKLRHAEAAITCEMTSQRLILVNQPKQAGAYSTKSRWHAKLSRRFEAAADALAAEQTNVAHASKPVFKSKEKPHENAKK